MRTLRRLAATGPVLLTAAGSALLAAACQAPPPAPPTAPVRTAMYRHFALARDLRTFSVTGELEMIRTVAAELARTEEAWGLPPGADARVARIKELARRAASSTDIADAHHAVSALAAECGACHLANDVDLGGRFQTAPPLADGSVARHMNYLAWISRLLWDGLVGPSQRTWTTGAGALVGDDAFPDPAARHVPPTEVERSARRLRDLGEEAVLAEDAASRANILAQVWDVCADCHLQAGVR